MKPDAFATSLVMGVGSEQARIDSLISAHAIGWVMDRMPVLDRALLRMGTYELLAHDDVPMAVIISEAVDLATQYSTDESGRFVNGVLAAIATDVRGEAGSSPGAADSLDPGEVLDLPGVVDSSAPPGSLDSSDSSE